MLAMLAMLALAASLVSNTGFGGLKLNPPGQPMTAPMGIFSNGHEVARIYPDGSFKCLAKVTKEQMGALMAEPVGMVAYVALCGHRRR